MTKSDAAIIVVGITKDILRLAVGILFYGLDLEVTGYLFAELAPLFIVLGWAENVDSEYILDARSEHKVPTNFYALLGFFILVYYAIYSRDIFFFVSIYYFSRIGYLYYRTEMLELNEHIKLMRQKIAEIFLLLILLLIHPNIEREWVIVIFLVIPAIPSLVDPIRYSSFRLPILKRISANELTVVVSARSLSLMLKNVMGNLDVVILANMGNPAGAGLIKYVKSLGNGQNLIVSQLIERYRESCLKRLVDLRKTRVLLFLVVMLLGFGLFFGVMLINLIFPILRQFITVPELPHLAIFYFMMLAVSPIIRIIYLYSSTMFKSLISQFLISIGMVTLFLMGHDQAVVYLLLPVTIGLLVFLYNLISLR